MFPVDRSYGEQNEGSLSKTFIAGCEVWGGCYHIDRAFVHGSLSGAGYRKKYITMGLRLLEDEKTTRT